MVRSSFEVAFLWGLGDPRATDWSIPAAIPKTPLVQFADPERCCWCGRLVHAASFASENRSSCRACSIARG
jgi:hypothetical protein